MNTRTKGKIAAILLSMAMVFTMMPMTATPVYANTMKYEYDGVEYTYDTNDETRTATVTKYKGSESNITILQSFNYLGNNYTVRSIGNSAFQRCGTLESITIPNSVTAIEKNAFEYCNNLTNITFPETVTSIGEYAFHECESLTSITIPASVTSIGTCSFGEAGLTSVTFESESALTSIGEYAFQNCDSLTSITIPASVTSVGNHAFQGCDSLTSVTIPKSVRSIGEYAFYECESLTSITIPASVTSMGTSSFEESGLTSVTFESESALTSIGTSAFKKCADLTSFTIPAGVTSIGDFAFQECTDLKSVTIPKSVTSLGMGSFERSGLTSVTFENGSALTSIEENAFKKCADLTSITIPASVTSMGTSSFEESGLTSVTFENGSALTSIEENAFKKCADLTSITIPSSVTSIGSCAFGDCDKFDVVFFLGTEDQWNTMSGRDSHWADGRENDINVVFVKGVEYIVEAPEGEILTYNGNAQTGVAAGTGYTLDGTTSAKDVGSYQATATLEENYVWSDGTTDPKTIDWSIASAVIEVAVPTGKNFTYNGKAQTGVAVGSNYTLSGTTKATNAGSYTAKATLKTDANHTYKWTDGTTAVKSITWKINKAKNPLAMKPKTATVKYKSLKKKAQPLAVTKVITFTKNAKDKKNYTLSSAKKGKKSFKKFFAVNKTTGKVTVKKGLKKGTYKVQVKVKALGNANYNASAWKAVTFTVKVK